VPNCAWYTIIICDMSFTHSDVEVFSTPFHSHLKLKSGLGKHFKFLSPFSLSVFFSSLLFNQIPSTPIWMSGLVHFNKIAQDGYTKVGRLRWCNGSNLPSTSCPGHSNIPQDPLQFISKKLLLFPFRHPRSSMIILKKVQILSFRFWSDSQKMTISV
jgi:hypothetical protein